MSVRDLIILFFLHQYKCQATRSFIIIPTAFLCKSDMCSPREDKPLKINRSKGVFAPCFVSMFFYFSSSSFGTNANITSAMTKRDAMERTPHLLCPVTDVIIAMSMGPITAAYLPKIL